MHSQRAGTTLWELLITLAVIAILLTVAAPSMRSSMHTLSVRAARESAFGLFSRARVIALQQGGAEIKIDDADDRISVRNRDGTVITEQWFAPERVDVVIENGDSAVLRYDGYGLGRMMSRTVTFASGDARAGLTISSFGRARRW